MIEHPHMPSDSFQVWDHVSNLQEISNRTWIKKKKDMGLKGESPWCCG